MRLIPIATAFPGLLDWETLWGLDFREEAVLSRMAAVAKLQQEADTARAVRLGMATEKSYLQRMNSINSEIANLVSCRTREEVVSQNRSALRRLFGVKEKKNG